MGTTIIISVICSITTTFFVSKYIYKQFVKSLDKIEKKHREELLSITINAINRHHA